MKPAPEKAVNTIAPLGIRTVKVRTGLVLRAKVLAFCKKPAPVFRYGFGSALGSGNQYMPWIHIHDLCAIYLEALENEAMQGAYNAAIEDNTTNSLFSKTLAYIYGYSVSTRHRNQQVEAIYRSYRPVMSKLRSMALHDPPAGGQLPPRQGITSLGETVLGPVQADLGLAVTRAAAWRTKALAQFAGEGVASARVCLKTCTRRWALTAADDRVERSDRSSQRPSRFTARHCAPSSGTYVSAPHRRQWKER